MLNRLNKPILYIDLRGISCRFQGDWIVGAGNDYQKGVPKKLKISSTDVSRRHDICWLLHFGLS